MLLCYRRELSDHQLLGLSTKNCPVLLLSGSAQHREETLVRLEGSKDKEPPVGQMKRNMSWPDLGSSKTYH
jgi:hypothetical protein